jgi:hypothetical protein
MRMLGQQVRSYYRRVFRADISTFGLVGLIGLEGLEIRKLSLDPEHPVRNFRKISKFQLIGKSRPLSAHYSRKSSPHSTHWKKPSPFNPLEKAVPIQPIGKSRPVQPIGKSRPHPTHMKKPSSFNSIEKAIFIQPITADGTSAFPGTG